MNYDLYEVEVETGIPGYRVVQHVRAIDSAEAQAKVEQDQEAPAIRVDFKRPCKPYEIAAAIKAGVIPEGTKATEVNADGVPIDVKQIEAKP